MAEDIENSGESAPKPEANRELPRVESPPLSPAGEVIAMPAPAVEPTVAPEPEEKIMAKPAAWRLRMRARHRRRAVLAASVTIAASIGALVGALVMSGVGTPSSGTAALPQRQALEQSIDRLNGELAALKASVEAGSKSARSQIAKTAERLDRPAEPQTTGSIATPSAPIPTPPPRPDIRATVVHDWSIHDVRDGYVYVQGHGDIYQVVLGAPLPGLGPVQQIKRDGGRWVVVTPHGLIVSQRDRRYFETN